MPKRISPIPHPQAKQLLADLFAYAKSRGVPDKVLCSDAGFGQNNLPAIKYHRRNVSFDTICRLAAAAGMTVKAVPND